MTDDRAPQVLTINTGSSSLKAALYEMGEKPRALISARVERIGLAGSQIDVQDASGAALLADRRDYLSHHTALQVVLECFQRHGYSECLEAIGHRVVHGGRSYSEPQIVTDELVEALRRLIPIDPTHLPQAIDAIETVRHDYPAIVQVACFDTAFHRHMPRVAQLYALPRRFEDAGVVRYGFHGLSYESIMEQLRSLDPVAADGRVVIAHLGNGASMAAVRGGKGIDTTMGFSPTGGLVMGTRSGDLDPAVMLHLLQSDNLDVDSLSDLVNKQAGMLGISGLSADMQVLLQEQAVNRQAAEAVELFCYQARKFLGALVAALGGLDTLVFTAGIGEHAAPVRERICAGMDFLGIQIDPDRNRRHRPVISPDASPVTVRVMRTDEDLMIARHTARLMAQRGERRVPV